MFHRAIRQMSTLPRYFLERCRTRTNDYTFCKRCSILCKTESRRRKSESLVSDDRREDLERSIGIPRKASFLAVRFPWLKITFGVVRTKKRRTTRVAAVPVDKHYPFTRSPLTDKPIIRHSALTSQLFYQSAPPGLLVGRRNDDVLRTSGDRRRRNNQKRKEEERRWTEARRERREEARVFLAGESYNSTKHNPRVNLTSPVRASWTNEGRRRW